jgi:hypothetical protein
MDYMDMMQPVITINSYGDKFWRLKGDLHRTDGPAIEWANGKDDKEWFLNGKPYLFEEWLDHTPGLTDKQKTFRRLQYG